MIHLPNLFVLVDKVIILGDDNRDGFLEFILLALDSHDLVEEELVIVLQLADIEINRSTGY